MKKSYQSYSKVILCIFIVLQLGACGSDDAPVTAPGPALLSNFQAASVVIGQADFSGGTQNQGGLMPGANTLFSPISAPFAGSLYQTDFNNERILGFNSIPGMNNANADFVMGQVDFESNTAGTDTNQFDGPSGLVTSGGRLFVSEFRNNRVLIWNSLPTSNAPADVVLGAINFTTVGGGTSQTAMTGPAKLTVAGGRLFVADYTNNRVLIWNSIPGGNNVPADVVVGQINFTNNAPGVTATQLASPIDIWSDGVRMVIADSGNNRVLIWNTIPTGNGIAADVVIGQADFMSNVPGSIQGLAEPSGVTSDGRRLYIADRGNNRVLIFNSFPISNVTADHVLGQDDFISATGNDDDQDGVADVNPTARTLKLPSGVNIINNQLFVADDGNHRVLIYPGK